MALIWWLPAATLVSGLSIVVFRARAVEHEISATNEALARLTALGECGGALAAAVSLAASHRARTSNSLIPGPAARPDGGPHHTGR